MRIALYARVSKASEQTPENQYQPLLSWLATSHNEQVKDTSHPLGIFVDEVSSRDTRPKKEEVLRLLRLGQADGVCFVALDRWGRSMSELVLELEEFSKTGKSLISLKEGLDLSTAAGRLMANVLAAMAAFERDRIKERTLMGLKRAKSQGKIRGRHPVGCGCGKLGKDGKRHNGSVKPIRDAHNCMVGWQNQTSPEIAIPKADGQVVPQHTPVCLVQPEAATSASTL